MTKSNRPDVNKPLDDYGDLVELLNQRKGYLSKRLQQVAQFCLNNPEDAALYNIVDLAAQANVPPSAITRFSKELGFSGFNDMQRVFRQRLVGPKVSYADRLRTLSNAADRVQTKQADLDNPSGVFDTFVQGAMDALLRLSEEVDRHEMAGFVATLDAANAVHIVASKGAYGVGSYCYFGISNVGKPTHLIDNTGSMRKEQFNAVGINDVVLVITFDDYTPETIEVAQWAKNQGRKLLVITDNELSPIANFGEQTLYVKEAHLGHFRSQVPAMVLCQSLIVSLAKTRTSG